MTTPIIGEAVTRYGLTLVDDLRILPTVYAIDDDQAR